MRFCILCSKPMHTSIENIWIEGTNYDIHVGCKKECCEKQLVIGKNVNSANAKEENCK